MRSYCLWCSQNKNQGEQQIEKELRTWEVDKSRIDRPTDQENKIGMVGDFFFLFWDVTSSKWFILKVCLLSDFIALLLLLLLLFYKLSAFSQLLFLLSVCSRNWTVSIILNCTFYPQPVIWLFFTLNLIVSISDKPIMMCSV